MGVEENQNEDELEGASVWKSIRESSKRRAFLKDSYAKCIKGGEKSTDEVKSDDTADNKENEEVEKHNKDETLEITAEKNSKSKIEIFASIKDLKNLKTKVVETEEGETS